jgi:hypothetical protein
MIQTSDSTSTTTGKPVRVMEDDEVRDRLRRIAAYNRSFVGTHHVVTEGEIYGWMTQEWHVDPAVYGIRMSAPVPWTPMKKGEVRQRVGWLPGGEKMVVPAKKKGAAREI